MNQYPQVREFMRELHPLQVRPRRTPDEDRIVTWTNMTVPIWNWITTLAPREAIRLKYQGDLLDPPMANHPLLTRIIEGEGRAPASEGLSPSPRVSVPGIGIPYHSKNPTPRIDPSSLH